MQSTSQGPDQQPSTQQNSNKEILVIPYAKTGDQYNLPDDVLAGVWRKLFEQNLLKTLFYDGSVADVDAFIQMMKRPSNLPCLAYDGELLGIAWLNDIAKNRALAHFCFFKEAWGRKSLKSGKKIIDYWFDLNDQNGEPIFKVLIGNTPTFNRQALKFISKLGFDIIGEIPHVGAISYLEGSARPWVQRAAEKKHPHPDHKQP